MTGPDEADHRDHLRDESVREPRPGHGGGLGEASRYFMGRAAVQRAARRLAARLDELRIEYAIVGGLAVTAHGHVRTTADVDVLLTSEGLARFKEASLGHGWVEKFRGSVGVRDAVLDVPIDVLVTGGHPGDGVPKGGVTFPEPTDVMVAEGGVRFLDLRGLVELKLASGLSAPDRPRDFDDVIQLIRARDLSREFGESLHESVRAKYDELWGYAQRPKGEF